jgi:hypothetical protein
MTAETLAKYRALAEKRSWRKSGRVVLDLLDEIDRLRALWDRNQVQRGVVSDESLMPFGQYKGERLANVPEDYLLWWLKQNNRDALQIDADFGKHPTNFIAQRKLKIYDYIQQRIANETAETQLEVSEAEILARVREVFPDATVISE